MSKYGGGRLGGNGGGGGGGTLLRSKLLKIRRVFRAGCWAGRKASDGLVCGKKEELRLPDRISKKREGGGGLPRRGTRGNLRRQVVERVRTRGVLLTPSPGSKGGLGTRH